MENEVESEILNTLQKRFNDLQLKLKFAIVCQKKYIGLIYKIPKSAVPNQDKNSVKLINYHSLTRLERSYRISKDNEIVWIFYDCSNTVRLLFRY